jgi:hypothetical protein
MKKYLLAILTIGVLVAPSVSSAQSTDDLLRIVASLQAQIENLRAQISQLQTRQTGSSDLVRPKPPAGSRFIQISYGEVITSPSSDVPPATLDVKAGPGAKCFDYGPTDSDTGRPVLCSGITTNADTVYHVSVTDQTRLMNVNRDRLVLDDVDTGDTVNLYGYQGTDGTVDARILRDMSKPSTGNNTDTGSTNPTVLIPPQAVSKNVYLNNKFELGLHQGAVIIDYRNAIFTFSGLTLPRCATDVTNCTKAFGSLSFMVPNGDAGDFNIEVGASKTFTAVTISFLEWNGVNGVFLVSGQPIVNTPQITVLSPNGGEVWQIGTYHVINWTGGTTYDKIGIYLDKFSDSTGISTQILQTYPVVNTGNTNGTYGWNIPSTLSVGSYKVKVCTLTSSGVANTDLTPSLCDSSDAPFSIVSAGTPENPEPNYPTVLPPAVTGINPSSGPGETQVTLTGTNFLGANSVKFTSVSGNSFYLNNLTSPNNLSLSFTLNSFSTCAPSTTVYCPAIATAPPPGVYSVVVSNPLGNSNAVSFTITRVTQNSGISVISPNGGESWPIGSTKAISWNSTNATQGSWVALLLNKSGGEYSVIAQNLPTTGSYNWTVPKFSCFGGDACGELLPGSYVVTARLYTGPTLCIGYCAPGTQPTQLASSASGPFNITSASTLTKPVISSITPSSGSAGTTVTIKGSDFTSNNSVKFTYATFSYINNLNSADGTTITFKLPSALSACGYGTTFCIQSALSLDVGSHLVSVINANGTSNLKSFSVTAGTYNTDTSAITNNQTASLLQQMSAILQSLAGLLSN